MMSSKAKKPGFKNFERESRNIIQTKPTMGGNGKSGKAGKKAKSKSKARSKFKARRDEDTMRPRVLNNLSIAAMNRASPFSSSSPGPRPSSSTSGPGNEGTKKLKAPPRPIAMPFMGQIKEARSARDAIRVVAKIERQGYHPNMFHYSAIISKCAKEKLVDKALGLLKRMIYQGVAPNEVVFLSVINACAKAGQYKIAISLLNDMEDKYGVKPNVKCFSSAISACEKASQWEEAVKLLRKMTEKGVGPNVYCYSSVISACGKCAKWEKALKFLAEMEEMGIPPSVYSYNSAISACEKAAKWEEAVKLLAKMKEEGIQPNVVSCSSAISACEKGGAKYTDTALSLFAEMKKAGVNPNDVTYNAITQACFDSKRYFEALELARKAMCRGIWLIKISTEKGQPMWDLHDLREAIACMLLTDALLAYARSSSEESSPSYQDIIVITGKGLRTIESKDPVLREKVPAFLKDVAGLKTTAIEENEGRFLITATSLEEWVESGACEKFKGLIQNR